MAISGDASPEPLAPVAPSQTGGKERPVSWRLVVAELRPRQWVKNLVAYAPLLFSQQAHHLPRIVDASLCVLAFCLVSGGVYTLNDVVDAQADRLHPVKRLRPIASGQLSRRLALCVGIFCVLVGLAISYLVRPLLAVVTISYLALSVLYSLVLKHHTILDVFGIAAGFVLRAVGGCVAVHVATSGWFLVGTSLGALFLGLEKRRQELRLLEAASSQHRKALGEYSIALLDRMEGIIVPSLLTSYMFFSFLSPHGQWMMLTVPPVLYGVMRYQYLSVRGATTGRPEDVFWSDRPIQIALIVWIVTCALVLYNVPQWLHETVKQIDAFRVFK